MNLPRLLLAASLATGTLSTLRADDVVRPTPPRFSVEHMDRSVDPRADFARFAFGHWVETNAIPPDKARWGGFDELAQYNWAALKSVLEAATARSHEPGSVEQQVGDFYASAMNTAAIDAAGLAPIQPELDRIAGIATADELARVLAAFHHQSIGGLFGVGVGADQKRSDINALYARQGGTSLPSKDYYFGEPYARFRAAFAEHVAKMFVLASATPEAAATDAQTVLAFETALATHAKAPVELRDRLANYNKMPAADLAALAPSFPFALYLAERGLTGPAAAEIIVGQPKFFSGLETVLTTHPLADVRTYLRYRVLSAAAPFLAAPFEEERFRFYGTTLAGTPAMEPRWQRAAKVVDGSIGEALGQLYVAQYYPPEAKARMAEMIANIQAVMRDRLAQLEWMTEPTRQKALAKFERFVARIGHPDTWKDYATVAVTRDSYFANVRAANAYEMQRDLAKLGQPVDKSEWNMTPPTVNAYFQPTANQIVFPAGILQPPFFDFTLDDAVNYGAIGAVIGHEITHGFDDQGRRYDADGNLADWWTAEDEAQFKARAQMLIDQYNAYEPLPGAHVNGQLTLGENIADLGGSSIAFEALQRSLAGKERKLIDGFTPEQRFYLSWAQQWRSNIRDNALRQRLATDSHSPGLFRAIGPLVNQQTFFDAFGIKEGDPMWKTPEDRAVIW